MSVTEKMCFNPLRLLSANTAKLHKSANSLLLTAKSANTVQIFLHRHVVTPDTQAQPGGKKRETGDVRKDM